jgi:hypothetical protein
MNHSELMNFGFSFITYCMTSNTNWVSISNWDTISIVIITVSWFTNTNTWVKISITIFIFTAIGIKSKASLQRSLDD